MTTAKHTPGPWCVVVGEVASLAFKKNMVRNRKLDRAVADCDFQNGDEGAANAHLIAAAPDMLAALKQAEIWLSYTETTDPISTNRQNAAALKVEISAAIAKAMFGN